MAESDLNSPVIEMVDAAVTAGAAPDVVLIEGVNWTVLSGDHWVVGGLPSSGKSDLLNAGAGLARLGRGVHRLFGRETGHLSEEELIQIRLRVGIVFAGEGRLFNHLTVAENLALPLCYHRNCRLAEAEERVRAILEATGLFRWAGQTPGAMSRNLRARVGLARALALDPELLLLDDPLRGKDPRETRWWLEFLAALRAGHEVMSGRKVTLVATADNFRPWLDQAEKFALIKDRQWLFLGGRSEVRTHEEPLLRELLLEGFIGD